MQPLQTPRLTLIPLTRDQLARYLDDREILEAGLGLARSGASTPDPLRHAIGVKLEKMRIDPDNWLWYTYWLIVLRETRGAVGAAGFKDVPDKGGEVEIGYGLEPSFRGHGYMTEALAALIEWASARRPTLRITAQTLRENAASHGVLQRLGFVQTSETDLVYRWRLDDQGLYHGSEQRDD